jgi:hypothetical protein
MPSATIRRLCAAPLWAFTRPSFGGRLPCMCANVGQWVAMQAPALARAREGPHAGGWLFAFSPAPRTVSLAPPPLPTSLLFRNADCTTLCSFRCGTAWVGRISFAAAWHRRAKTGLRMPLGRSPLAFRPHRAPRNSVLPRRSFVSTRGSSRYARTGGSFLWVRLPPLS